MTGSYYRQRLRLGEGKEFEKLSFSHCTAVHQGKNVHSQLPQPFFCQTVC